MHRNYCVVVSRVDMGFEGQKWDQKGVGEKDNCKRNKYIQRQSVSCGEMLT